MSSIIFNEGGRLISFNLSHSKNILALIHVISLGRYTEVIPFDKIVVNKDLLIFCI